MITIGGMRLGLTVVDFMSCFHCWLVAARLGVVISVPCVQWFVFALQAESTEEVIFCKLALI